MTENKTGTSKTERVLNLVNLARRASERIKNKGESAIEIEASEQIVPCGVAMQRARIENGVCQNGCQRLRLGGEPFIENSSITSCWDGKNVAEINLEILVSDSGVDN
jgi:hypothetical protein